MFYTDDIKVEFIGTETFPENQIIGLMETKSGNVFKEATFDLDLKRIKKFYFDNGFFNALIDTALERRSYTDEDNEVDIKIIVIEKERFSVYNVIYNGLDDLDEQVKKQLYTEQLFKFGFYYSRQNVLEETKRITELLQNNGYYFARLDTTKGTIISKYLTNQPLLQNRVNVTLNFSGTEKKYVFGKTKIDIIDNKYGVTEDLLRRELEYTEGELFNREKVLLSERNFTKLAIIENGRITVDSINSDNSITFKITTTLNKKYEVTPNIKGTDIQGEFYGGLGILYSDKYFFKGGRTFSAELYGLIHSKDVNRLELSLKLFQPYIFNNNISATLNTKFGIHNTIELQLYSLSNLIRVNYFISPYTFYQYLYADLTADLLRLKAKQDIIENGEVIMPNGEISNIMNSILGITIVHDNTNDLFNPSSGFYQSFTIENAGLLPKAINALKNNISYPQYFKLYLPVRFYFDISSGTRVSILATKLYIGDIIEYGTSENIIPVPYLYRFYSGGGNSVRGWYGKSNGAMEDPSLGGNFLFEGSLEYRWKAFYLASNFMKDFWVVPFLDYGNVWTTHKTFSLNKIALATGIGIRYDTFVGPLRIDLGFKLYDPSAPDNAKWLFNKFTFKEKFAFQFGIGNAF